MSVASCLPILECVYCLGCIRWVWKKFLYTAGRESENWGLATATEFEPVPRFCKYILSVYEDDLQNPLWSPPGGYGINPEWIILKKTHNETEGKVTPYMIYVDHNNAEIIVAIRGLTLAKESDFLVLLDNKLGQTKFDGGYVHNGLLKAAQWVFEQDADILRGLLEKYPDYRLTFIGHSLGAGVVTMLAILAIKNRERLGNIDRRRIRCFAIAPARCISLNLAVRYADVINSIVLQEKMLKDPRRLYAPGRLYHILVRKPFSLGKISPIVKTAVPVDGRFEHIVLSFNLTADHAILWILQESQRALDNMLEREGIMDIPPEQRMQRQASLAKEHMEEHRAALQRAVALDVPQAYSPSAYGTFREVEEGEHSDRMGISLSPSMREKSWDDLVLRLFETDESGQMVLRNC